MNTAVLTAATIQHVEVSNEAITAHLVDGRVISVPLAWSWRLSDATPAQRANWELIGNGHGIHWPDVDEDISAEGMLSGAPARRPRQALRRMTVPASKGAAAGEPLATQGQADSPVSRGSRLKTQAFGGRLPINVAALTDLDDHDDERHVSNLVQDSVVALSKSVSILPRKLLATRRPRVARQRRNLRDDPPALLLRESFNLLAGRRLDEKLQLATTPEILHDGLEVEVRLPGSVAKGGEIVGVFGETVP